MLPPSSICRRQLGPIDRVSKQVLSNECSWQLFRGNGIDWHSWPSSDSGEMKYDAKNGARNLLEGCGKLTRGDSLLVLFESEKLGYYDAGLVDSVRDCAKSLGIKTEFLEVPLSRSGAEPSPDLIAKMKTFDRTLFLARLGDQIRFRRSMSGIRPIVSYALDCEMLASGFGQADYGGFVRLKDAVNSAMGAAQKVSITCPLGTDFEGGGVDYPDEHEDVTIARFPMSVFTPVPTGNFTGTVAQAGFLVGTGSKYYEPYACRLEGVLLVEIEGNRIAGFRGTSADVRAAEAHYRMLAELFDIEKFFVHSWHAGIHPGCDFRQPASSNFERWSGGAFGNPRLMHVHTCGTYAPGEISLNVLDPTISIDGVAVWDRGRFHPERIEGGAEILEVYPDIRSLFDHPSQNCGLGADGQLSFD